MGKVAYRLDLPEELSQIHSTFHVSQLWKCLVDDLVVVSLEDIHMDDRHNNIDRTVAIFDRRTKNMKIRL